MIHLGIHDLTLTSVSHFFSQNTLCQHNELTLLNGLFYLRTQGSSRVIHEPLNY